MALLRLPIMMLALLVAVAPAPVGDATAASRRLAASAQEIWARWLEFLGDGEDEISKGRFEEVFGLELRNTQRLGDGIVRHTVRIEYGGGRFLLAAIDSHVKENTYSLAAIQWTSHFFDHDGQCLADVEALTADLAKLRWTPSLPPTPVGALFRKGYAELAYSRHWGSHFQYCGISLRPHRFSIERLDRV